LAKRVINNSEKEYKDYKTIILISYSGYGLPRTYERQTEYFRVKQKSGKVSLIPYRYISFSRL